MIPIHPILVHFPVALLTAYVIAAVSAYFFRSDWLEKTAGFLLLLGVIAALAAVTTGKIAESAIAPPAASVGEMHETFATLTTVLFSALFMLQLRMRNSGNRTLKTVLIALSLVGLVLLILTAYYGGRLVYDFGTGVQPPR